MAPLLAPSLTGSPLNFSSTNEDGETERAALAGSRRILCLTGTGTRALDLLLTGAEVVALDANPAQNALLSLKAAAMRLSTRDDYLGFIGIAPSTGRAKRYAEIRQGLPPAARDYWDGRPRLIASGVFHAGRWERLLRVNAAVLARFRGRAVKAVMSAATVAEQAEAWRSGLARPGRLRVVETLGRDLVWRLAMREPARAFMPDARAVGERIDAAFAQASRTFLFRDSPAATLALCGRLRPDGALPTYLHPDHYDEVRSALGRLRLVQGALADLGRLELGRFDGFSLSDFGSYCGPAEYRAAWEGVAAVASPGARWCERIFINDMPPPLPAIAVDAALSAKLTAADRSVVYRVRAGVIR